MNGTLITLGIETPDEQSLAIDRIIYDKAIPPIVYDSQHSIFPIESVCGLLEITMSLDATKLKTDIERMAPIKAMQERWYLVPFRDSTTKTYSERIYIPPRSYVIGLPTDCNWKPETIAKTLKKIQQKLGPPTKVHGLYVIGIGFFETLPLGDDPSGVEYRIRYWPDPDRIFRFSVSFRQSFERWPLFPDNRAADLDRYVPGKHKMLID